jgi:FMN-dependent NADH-azoreductase
MLHLMIGGNQTMSTLLKLDSSPMGDRSISRKLTTKFAESWLKTHPGGKVIERDLTTLNLPVVDAFWVGAAFTPEASRTSDQTKALAASDSLIDDLKQADEYVFGVPMHAQTLDRSSDPRRQNIFVRGDWSEGAADR